MNSTAISILIAAALIAGAIMFSAVGGDSGANNDTSPTVSNVGVVDGVQTIAITAKGDYSPRATTAKADTQTTIKVTTSGTFDCSSALTIPSLGYRTNLPPSGTTDIQVPPQKAGTKLVGLCAMGMYNFTITFE